MNRIKYLRLLNGMKQVDLAKEIRVSQSSLSGYESGNFEPDSNTLLKLADLFHVSLDYLLGREDSYSAEDHMLKKIPVYKHMKSNYQETMPVLAYYQEMSPCVSPSVEYFGYYISMDCMEPRICIGDLVIARKQKEIPNGSIVVVQIGEKEAVVKKFWKLNGGEIVLLSFNAKYHPDFFTAEQVTSLPIHVLGMVVESRSKFE